jgi:hypothetical protein
MARFLNQLISLQPKEHNNPARKIDLIETAYQDCAPDYSQKDIKFNIPNSFFPTSWTGNALTTGTSYTIPDSGHMLINAACNASSLYEVTLKINEVKMNKSVAAGHFYHILIPVTKGDIVSLSIYSSVARSVTWHIGILVIIPPLLVSSINDNYSTEETNTGRKWVDGKDIYRKVIKDFILGTSPVTIGTIEDINELVTWRGTLYQPPSDKYHTIEYSNYPAGQSSHLQLMSGVLTYFYYNLPWQGFKITLIIEYTKI